MLSCMRYLATVRRAMLMPLLAEVLGDFGVGQRSILVLDEFLDDVLDAQRGREEVAVGNHFAGRQHHVLARPWHGSTVDSWMPSSSAIAARLSGLRCRMPSQRNSRWRLDQTAGDVVERLSPLIDVGDEQLGATDVLLDVPPIVGIQAGRLARGGRPELRVHRIDPQEEALGLDHVDLERAVFLAIHDDVGQDVHRARVAVAIVGGGVTVGGVGVELGLDEIPHRRHGVGGDVQLLRDPPNFRSPSSSRCASMTSRAYGCSTPLRAR